MAKTKEESEKIVQGTVVKEFRSIDDFNLVHEVGDELSGLSDERLASLVEKGLVELPAPPPTDPPK